MKRIYSLNQTEILWDTSVDYEDWSEPKDAGVMPEITSERLEEIWRVLGPLLKEAREDGFDDAVRVLRAAGFKDEAAYLDDVGPEYLDKNKA